MIDISLINIACFVIFMSGDMFDKPTLMHISAVGVAISLFFSLWMLIGARRMRDTHEKNRVARCITSLIFCSFFTLFYFLKMWWAE